MTYTGSYQPQNNGSSVYSPFNRTAGAQPAPSYQGYPDAVPAAGFGAGVPATNPSMGADVYLPPASAEDIDTLSGNIDSKIAQIRQAFSQQPAPAMPGAAPAPGAPAAPAVPQAEIDWALQLEQKVTTQNYQPNAQETARYEDIARRLSAPAAAAPPAGAPTAPAAPAAPAVPQAEIDWALQLEQKVTTQNYQPNAQETARYEDIARRLSAPAAAAAPAAAPAAAATPAAPAVPQADIQWALDLEQKVTTQNYQPNAQETARYEDIARRLSAPAPAAPAAPAAAPPGNRNWADWSKPFNVPAAPNMPLPIAGPGGQAAVTVPTSLRGAPQTPPAAMLNQQPGAAPQAPGAAPAPVSQQEIDWALQLEQRVNSQNYQPNQQEMTQYQNIAQRMQAAQAQPQAPAQAPAQAPPVAPAFQQAPAPQQQPAAPLPSNVSQQEIDWALQLEQKVTTQNYQPNAQEMAAYQNIAQRLQAAQAPAQAPAQQPAMAPQMAPPAQAPAPQQQPASPLPPGLSQQEIDWALQLETKVNTQNYQPNAQEMAAYQNIAQRINQQVAQQQTAPQAMPPQGQTYQPGPSLPGLPPAPPQPQMQAFNPQGAPQIPMVPQNYPMVQPQTPQMLVPPTPMPPLPGPQPQMAPQYGPQPGMPPAPQQQAPGVMDKLKNAWNALWS